MLLFGSKTQLEAFRPAICRMQRDGHSLYLFLVSSEEDTQGSLPRQWRLLPRCTVQVSSLPLDVDVLAQRLNLLACPPTAVITSGVAPAITDALRHVVSSDDGFFTTVMAIPDEDLAFCDWMGSLSVEAWRSE